VQCERAYAEKYGERADARERKKRKYPRVGLAVDSAIWSEVWQGRIGDAHPVGGVVTVLGGGAFIEVNEAYAEGDQVGLRFVLPGTHDEVACECVVREYIPGRGIGVEFTDISAIDRERVRAAASSLQMRTSGTGPSLGPHETSWSP